MARSPSPTGSTRSSNRGSRRSDDRYNRDRRENGYRSRRSRSRSKERGHRDSRHDDYRRRDRSLERREDLRDRESRRDRSRDRRRSRSPHGSSRRRRDHRDHRDSRDHRERRDDSRERRRQESHADPRQRERRGGSRDPTNTPNAEDVSSVFSTVAATERLIRQTLSLEAQKLIDEEKKKVERIARLQAWKAKQAADKEAKLKNAAAPSGIQILQDMDKKALGSPIGTASPGSPQVENDTNSAAYAGKFDPKAIMKRAPTKATSQVKLGMDAATFASGKSASLDVKAAITDKPKVGALPLSSGSSAKNKSEVSIADMRSDKKHARPLKAAGFGLSAKAASESDKKRGLDFGDEESTRKKLEKLPTPPLEENNNDAALADNKDDDDEDDVDMAEAEDEEEALAAARAAAEKRAAAETQGDGAVTNLDAVMEDVPAPAPETTEAMDEYDGEDEVDPLDAFMAGLSGPKPSKTVKLKSLSSKNNRQEPEALFDGGDDFGADNMEAVETNADDILAIKSKKRKRDIPNVDHTKASYEPFRKGFYTEPLDMQDITEEEVNNMRFELDGIKVRGVDVPKPVQSWAQCGLGTQTLDVIKSLQYDKPTSIQSQAIPAIMSGRDVIGVAKTGSGKTIAFLMPMFRHIKDQRPLESMEGPVGLVMTPTRELATQIHRECKPFLKALGLRAVCAYGGAPIKDQIADLKRGAEIIVCTPGRMIELLTANSGRVTNLRRITYVVLDEADRMFDMGFEPQVMKIIGNIRPDRQTVLFSATFPRNMEALARKVLNKPVEIVVGGRSVVAPEITQIVEVRAENTKFVRLLELLGELYDKDEDARTLIFVDRQESADGLLRELMRKGYPCNSIHGGKDQIDRDSTIDDFKAGVIPIMIATSVAARGLDVKQLKLVVNYDAPNHLEDYVHRAGRTGRAGNTGTAVTFVTEDQDRYSVDIVKALKQSEAAVPEPLQKLAESFIEKVKAGKAKASASGFGGKGLEKLDQERDAARNRERKAYRTGDEPEEEENEGKPEEDIVAKAASTVTSAAAIAAAAALDNPLAKHLDENSIVVHKTEVAPKAGASAGGKDSGNALDRVRAAVANIGDRLSKRNQLNPGHPIDNKGPDAGAFHATLEINDFPQKARWAVTNRTNVAKILDSTGTSITTKGNFYAAGAKPPGPDDAPKLYILVEGDTELVVTTAMRELMRLLREGTVAAADMEARAPTSGRYNVV